MILMKRVINYTYLKKTIAGHIFSCCEGSIMRFFSTELNEVKSQNEPKKKPRKTHSHTEELNEYFNSTEDLRKLKSLLPPKLLVRKQVLPQALYILDKAIAVNFAKSIQPHLESRTGTIVEVNPGLGLLTDQLLKIGVKHLECIESMAHFTNHLLETHPELNLTNGDVLNIWKIAFQDRIDNGNRVANLFKNIPRKQWVEETSMKIVTSVGCSTFIKTLIYSIIFQTNLVWFGRPELYIAIPPRLYKQLTASPSDTYVFYRSTSVLFQLLFDIEVLEKLPRKGFFPWVSPKLFTKQTGSILIDTENMYLVRIAAKKDLPVPLEQMQPLWYFIRHHMSARSASVIPQLERWIPGCGVKIIATNCQSLNIGIFTEIGELLPYQILSLFKNFVSLPEFPECPFLASMESSFLKSEPVVESSIAIEAEGDSGHLVEELETDLMDEQYSNETINR